MSSISNNIINAVSFVISGGTQGKSANTNLDRLETAAAEVVYTSDFSIDEGSPMGDTRFIFTPNEVVDPDLGYLVAAYPAAPPVGVSLGIPNPSWLGSLFASASTWIPGIAAVAGTLGTIATRLSAGPLPLGLSSGSGYQLSTVMGNNYDRGRTSTSLLTVKPKLIQAGSTNLEGSIYGALSSNRPTPQLLNKANLMSSTGGGRNEYFSGVVTDGVATIQYGSDKVNYFSNQAVIRQSQVTRYRNARTLELPNFSPVGVANFVDMNLFYYSGSFDYTLSVKQTLPTAADAGGANYAITLTSLWGYLDDVGQLQLIAVPESGCTTLFLPSAPAGSTYSTSVTGSAVCPVAPRQTNPASYIPVFFLGFSVVSSSSGEVDPAPNVDLEFEARYYDADARTSQYSSVIVLEDYNGPLSIVRNVKYRVIPTAEQASVLASSLQPALGVEASSIINEVNQTLLGHNAGFLGSIKQMEAYLSKVGDPAAVTNLLHNRSATTGEGMTASGSKFLKSLKEARNIMHDTATLAEPLAMMASSMHTLNAASMHTLNSSAPPKKRSLFSSSTLAGYGELPVPDIEDLHKRLLTEPTSLASERPAEQPGPDSIAAGSTRVVVDQFGLHIKHKMHGVNAPEVVTTLHDHTDGEALQAALDASSPWDPDATLTKKRSEAMKAIQTAALFSLSDSEPSVDENPSKRRKTGKSKARRLREVVTNMICTAYKILPERIIATLHEFVKHMPSFDSLPFHCCDKELGVAILRAAFSSPKYTASGHGHIENARYTASGTGDLMASTFVPAAQITSSTLRRARRANETLTASSSPAERARACLDHGVAVVTQASSSSMASFEAEFTEPDTLGKRRYEAEQIQDTMHISDFMEDIEEEPETNDQFTSDGPPLAFTDKQLEAQKLFAEIYCTETTANKTILGDFTDFSSRGLLGADDTYADVPNSRLMTMAAAALNGKPSPALTVVNSATFPVILAPTPETAQCKLCTVVVTPNSFAGTSPWTKSAGKYQHYQVPLDVEVFSVYVSNVFRMDDSVLASLTGVCHNLWRLTEARSFFIDAVLNSGEQLDVEAISGNSFTLAVLVAAMGYPNGPWITGSVSKDGKTIEQIGDLGAKLDAFSQPANEVPSIIAPYNPSGLQSAELVAALNSAFNSRTTTGQPHYLTNSKSLSAILFPCDIKSIFLTGQVRMSSPGVTKQAKQNKAIAKAQASVLKVVGAFQAKRPELAKTPGAGAFMRFLKTSMEAVSAGTLTSEALKASFASTQDVPAATKTNENVAKIFELVLEGLNVKPEHVNTPKKPSTTDASVQELIATRSRAIVQRKSAVADLSSRNATLYTLSGQSVEFTPDVVKQYFGAKTPPSGGSGVFKGTLIKGAVPTSTGSKFEINNVFIPDLGPPPPTVPKGKKGKLGGSFMSDFTEQSMGL